MKSLIASIARYSKVLLFGASLSFLPLAATAVVYPDLVVSRPNPEPALPGNFDSFTPPVAATGAVSGTPALAEWSKTGGPDDALVLTGSGLSSYAVFGQTSGYNGTLRTPSVAMQDSLKAQVVLNADLPASSMYVFWPLNAAGAGKAVAVNQTELWWVGPDAAGSGDVISAFGRNLSYGSVAPAVYVKPAGSAGVFATVSASNGGKVDFKVPSLGAGSYEVWVHNGHGGHYGWSGPKTLNVRPEVAYTGSVFNVRNYGAAGNGSADDYPAIAAAMNAAGGSAGSHPVVYFPAGTYMMSQGLQPPAGIQLKGDGKNATFLKLNGSFGNGGMSYAMFFQDQPGWSGDIELRDMTLDANGNLKGSNANSINALVRFRSQTNQRFTNVSFVSNEHQQLDMVNSDHLRFTGCDFTGSGSYMGTARQVFFTGCNFYGQYQNLATAQLTMQSGGDVAMVNCTGRDSSDANPGCGRFAYLEGGFGSWRNFYMGGCQTFNMAPSASKADQNSGEQVLWEANNVNSTQMATGGGSNTVTLPRSGGFGGGAYTAVIENGKGLGQHRLITGDNGAGTLTVSPPWNVAPDGSSLVMVGYVFEHGYCYGNSLQGRADYASRITASAGFEPYSGTSDIVLDSNTVTQCRNGIVNFAIMDSGGGLQPNYWLTARNNNISYCLNGILSQFSQWSGASSQSASAILASQYAYNTISHMTSAAFSLGDYDGNSAPGTLDANVIQHNVASYVPNGISGLGDGKIRNTLDYRNSFSSGGSTAPTPTLIPTSTQVPVSSPTPGSPQPTPTATSTPMGLACPWDQGDVGSTGLAGGAVIQNGLWNIQGAGSDIYGSPDSFHYVYQPMTGDVTVVAHVLSVQNTHSTAKGGLMIRQSLSSDSAHAMVNLIGGDYEVEFIARATAGGSPVATAIGGGIPYWVKLVRQGSLFTGYASADGTTWKLVSSQTIEMSGTVYAGLVVCSHDVNQLNTSTFDQVSVAGSSAASCGSTAATETPSPTLTIPATTVPTVVPSTSTPTATRTATQAPTAVPTSVPTTVPSTVPTGTSSPVSTPSTVPTTGTTPVPTATTTPSVLSGKTFVAGPNPANSFTIFFWDQSKTADAHIALVNAGGQEVARRDMYSMPTGSVSAQMDVSGLATGSYVAKLTLSSGAKPNRQTKLAIFR